RLPLASEVVEHQVLAPGHEIEQLVEAPRLLAVEAAPEREEQPGDVDDDRGDGALDERPCDRHGEVGLAGAGRPAEREPGAALGEARDKLAADLHDRTGQRGDLEALERRRAVAEPDARLVEEPADSRLVLLPLSLARLRLAALRLAEA